jgi:hypothetical protein
MKGDAGGGGVRSTHRGVSRLDRIDGKAVAGTPMP